MSEDPAAISASKMSAYQFYVKIDGARQGAFKQSTAFGIPAIRFTYEVELQPSPSDPGSHSVPKPKYSPVVMTKEVDAASPQFFRAATTNESLKSVLFEFHHVIPEGKQEAYYQIKLTNAAVSHYKHYTGTLPEGGTNIFELEDVHFTYQRMDVHDFVGGTSATSTTAGSRTTPSGPPLIRPATTPASINRLPARLGEAGSALP